MFFPKFNTSLFHLRLKQEMIQQVKLVANEFKRVTQMQMSENTKRTIRENVAIHNQLMKMSEKTTELIDENDELKVKILKQKREIKILEDNAKKLIKKNVCNHQVSVIFIINLFVAIVTCVSNYMTSS